MHRSEEDYLKAIYELTINTNSKIIKSSDLADELGFTIQSVNEKIKRLDEKGYVKFVPYKGVSLTKKGLDESIRMIRTHRIWEVFLIEKLGYDWHQVHDIAENLEHAADDELIERIFNFIGRPTYCVHGNPIPTFNGNVSLIYKKSLIEFDIGNKFTLKRVFDNKRLLIALNNLGIKMQDTFEIVSKNSDFITLVKDSNKYELTIKQAKQLFGI